MSEPNKEYMSQLHNLKQSNLVHYTENTYPHGPHHNATWEAWIEVHELLSPAFNQEFGQQVYWSFQGQRRLARNEVARQVLYAIGYFEEGQIDVPRAVFQAQA
ncbi:hypothetical protein FRB90_004669 [Tulasnella sp. 427]|nr:hypothetical protein FRB90_004669 [Tulasnella sp. 427]